MANTIQSIPIYVPRYIPMRETFGRYCIGVNPLKIDQCRFASIPGNAVVGKCARSGLKRKQVGCNYLAFLVILRSALSPVKCREMLPTLDIWEYAQPIAASSRGREKEGKERKEKKENERQICWHPSYNRPRVGYICLSLYHALKHYEPAIQQGLAEVAD